MNRRKFVKISGPLCLLLMMCCASGSSAKKRGLRLVLFHTNDMHSRFDEIDLCAPPSPSPSSQTGRFGLVGSQNGCVFGGFPRLKTAYEQKRKEAMTPNPSVKSDFDVGTLFVNVGDTFQGTGFYTKFDPQKAAVMYRELGIEVATFGTNELRADVEKLKLFLKELPRPSLPIVVSNLQVSNKASWPSVKFDSTTKMVNGHKIGIVGYLTPKVMSLNIMENVTVKDDIRLLEKHVFNLIRKGVKIIIALVHADEETVKTIAREINGIDVIVSGHSHTFLYTGHNYPDSEAPSGEYPTLIQKKNSDVKVPIVQAFNSTKYLGRLVVDFNKKGEVIKTSGNPILLDSSYKQDAAMLSLVEDYKTYIGDVEREVIGSTSVYVEGRPEYCMLRECNFGDFVLDAYGDYYLRKTRDNSNRPTEIANDSDGKANQSKIGANKPIVMVNGSVFQYDMSIGQITRCQLRAAISNVQMVGVKLSGLDIYQDFERIFMNYDGKTPQTEFIQVSGLKVEINLGKPIGSRVISVTIPSGNGGAENYTEIDKNAVYTVILNEDLWRNGFVGYRHKSQIAIEMLDQTLYGVTIEAIGKSQSPIAPKNDGRISVIQNI